MSDNTTKWLKLHCRKCGRYLFIKSDWVDAPSLCECCRAAATENIILKITNYVRNRRKYIYKPTSSEVDRAVIQKDVVLIKKINKILADKESGEDHVISELLKDKQIQKLILKLDKEHKKIKPLEWGKKANFSYVRIFEGGSPGQGKKA